MTPGRLKAAAKAALIHFSGGVVVAALAAGLIFGLWFPYPYNVILGGNTLFLLLCGVDVVCGPILTLVLYSPTKPRAKWLLDIGLILLVQLSALVYGLHSIALTRPVWLAFELNGVRLQLIYLHCTTRSASRGPSLVKMAHSGPSQLLHVTDLACYSATCNDFPGEFHGFIRCSTGSKAAFGDAHGGASPCPNLGA